jgi:SAM-dependent methyltransferase
MLHILFNANNSINCIIFRTVWISIFVFSIFLNTAGAQDLDVPYEPSPPEVVDAMLDLALVDSTDYVIDLGSGDGRIVITAAERGAIGHGVDLDPQRIREARNNARQAGMDDRVLFLQEDLFETDFSQASVVTMYLWPQVNIKLRPTLLDALRPGTRVISHSHDMDEWQPDSLQVVKETDGSSARVYLWIIPARAAGKWTWNIEEQTYTVEVSQTFQEVSIHLNIDGNSYETDNAFLRGNRLAFSANIQGANHLYSGKIQEDSISGIAQIRVEDQERVVTWSAQRH